MKIKEIVVDEIPSYCGECMLFHTITQKANGDFTGYCFPIVGCQSGQYDLSQHEMSGDLLFRRHDCPLRFEAAQ